MKIITAASLASLVGYCQAACPNSCSAHIMCGVDEVVSVILYFTPKRVSLAFKMFVYNMPVTSSNALATMDGAPMECLVEIALKDSAHSN